MKRGKYAKQKKRAPLWYYAALLVLVTVFAFCAWYLADYFIGSRKQAGEYDDLAALVEAARDTAPTEQKEELSPDEPGAVDTDEGNVETLAPDREEKTVLPEYAPLYELNRDLAGWIAIEGTKVNYPVMQTPDRADYYLKRNFSGDYSAWGCIYAREECDLNVPSDNVTLYGHNMKDGSMFAALNKYTSRTFWQDHRYIRFDTLYEYHTYEIFAVFNTTATVGKGFEYHNFIDAADEAEFDGFIAECLDLSFYDTGIVPEYGDKIICLSTCEYTQVNGRLVVAAVRID